MHGLESQKGIRVSMYACLRPPMSDPTLWHYKESRKAMLSSTLPFPNSISTNHVNNKANNNRI